MKRAMPILCIFSIFLFGCFGTKQVTTTLRIPAKFDFAPPSRLASGSAGMTIALIKPVYVVETPENYIQPFLEISSSMGNDFEELLTAKGFQIRGPYKTRDEMVYADKQSCDFAFHVQIDLQPNYNRKYKYDAGLGSIVPATYKMNGEITLAGSLVLTASSSQYGEKIWKKSIALDRQTFTYQGGIKWNAVPSVADELTQDNVFYNLMAKELEKFYAGAMSLAWQQIEVEEMKTVAQQAKKADKR